MKSWGLLLIGFGAGVIVGARSEGPAMTLAVLTIVVGLSLFIAGARSGGHDLVGDATEARTAAPASLKDLGPRVEQLLKLAEEQADAVVAEAEVKADRIVAQARVEAERLRSE